jgi:hypothetical protein
LGGEGGDDAMEAITKVKEVSNKFVMHNFALFKTDCSSYLYDFIPVPN